MDPGFWPWEARSVVFYEGLRFWGGSGSRQAVVMDANGVQAVSVYHARPAMGRRIIIIILILLIIMTIYYYYHYYYHYIIIRRPIAGRAC